MDNSRLSTLQLAQCILDSGYKPSRQQICRLARKLLELHSKAPAPTPSSQLLIDRIAALTERASELEAQLTAVARDRDDILHRRRS